MEFGIKVTSPDKLRGGCVVVGVFESKKLTDAAKELDSLSEGYIKDIISQGDLDGKAGTTLLLHKVPGTQCKRILLLGLGKEQEFKDSVYISAAQSAFRALHAIGVTDCALFMADLPVVERDSAWKVTQLAKLAVESNYRFDQLKSNPEENKKPLRKITICLRNRDDLVDGEAAMSCGAAVAHGMSLTKDLGNLAPNICTPTYLADRAKELAKTYKLKLTVLDRKDMEKEKMGALLSVARGSHQPPKLIVLEYQGQGKKEKPVVLVGKGVTFDTGGISLKPAAEMDEMKFDMSGAASVLGTMKAVAEMSLPINVVAIVPATENMPGGSATKPGDVVTSMSGQTIEVLNTDAEGRLILCDALTYAQRYDPKCVIDVATLTGACVIALGNIATGLLSNDEALAQALIKAGTRSADRVWQLPLWDDYQELLKSNFADMANIGGRAGGTITAACFLSRYAKRYQWAHLDIAGTAWKSGKEKGSTGRPVPLLTQFLIDQAQGAKT